MKEITNHQLLNDLSELIEQGKEKIAIQVNSTMTLVYWQIGKRINEDILQNERAEYGKQIIVSISKKLTLKYGRSFTGRNIRRMMKFHEYFNNFQIVATLSPQLSWSHFVELISLEKHEARLFYIDKINTENWSVRHTRHQIERKVYERSEIANVQLPLIDKNIQHTFKDPYFLDFLGLKDGYLENDLEAAILKELESFILELGGKFSFVARQKRMIIDGQDFYLDLLFYHRKLKRLIAVELKIGRFKAAYKGQMELYLKWLNKYEKEEGENFPIGLILCTETSSEQVELLEMHKDGIMVAEYWTDLPPKAQLEAKIHSALVEARERLKRRKLL